MGASESKLPGKLPEVFGSMICSPDPPGCSPTLFASRLRMGDIDRNGGDAQNLSYAPTSFLLLVSLVCCPRASEEAAC